MLRRWKQSAVTEGWRFVINQLSGPCEERSQAAEKQGRAGGCQRSQGGGRRRPTWARPLGARAGDCHQAVSCVTQKAVSPSGTSDSSLPGFFLPSPASTYPPATRPLHTQTALRSAEAKQRLLKRVCEAPSLLRDVLGQKSTSPPRRGELGARLQLGKGAEVGGKGRQGTTHPCTLPGSSGT